MIQNFSDAVFAALFLLTAVSAAFVVFSGHIVRSAFALLMTLFGVAGLYVFLRADFLAGTQLLVYVGGILVLLLFAIMLTNRIKDVRFSNESRGKVPAALLSLAVFAALSISALAVPWPRRALPDLPTTAPLGRSLLADYLLPFEAVSVLLLVVMVGAAVIARRDWKADA